MVTVGACSQVSGVSFAMHFTALLNWCTCPSWAEPELCPCYSCSHMHVNMHVLMSIWGQKLPCARELERLEPMHIMRLASCVRLLFHGRLLQQPDTSREPAAVHLLNF